MHNESRILVVDDEAGLRASLAANLELEGYSVVEASSGAEAIDLFRRESFDLVITDIRMPGISGVDAFREIRKIRPDAAVVLMTAFTLEGIIEEALGEGVYAIVTKPFSMEHLIRMVSRVIGQSPILVVDDAVDQATALVAALRSVGLRAEAAYDGPTAIETARRAGVDVCVLDLVMPGMDGVAVCEEILRADPTALIVAISGHAVPEQMHRLMRMGGYACLRKPIDTRELVRTIARARGSSRRA